MDQDCKRDDESNDLVFVEEPLASFEEAAKSSRSTLTAPRIYESSKELSGHIGTIGALLAMPNGKHVASGGHDSMLKIWNRDDGSCMQSIALPQPIHSLLALNDQRLLAGLGGSHGIVKIDLQGLEESILETFRGHTDTVTDLALLHDGSTVVSCSLDKTLRLWSRRDGSLLDTLTGHTEAVTCLAVLPLAENVQAHCLEEKVVTGSRDCTLIIWNMTDRLPALTFEHGSHIWSVLCLSFQCILSGGEDTTIKLWDALSGSCLRVISHPDGASVRSLGALVAGDHIVVSGSDTSVRIWSLNTEQELQRLETTGVMRLVIVEDGQLIVAESIGIIRIWS